MKISILLILLAGLLITAGYASFDDQKSLAAWPVIDSALFASVGTIRLRWLDEVTLIFVMQHQVPAEFAFFLPSKNHF